MDLKIKRNESCPCGSGLKYKNCCLERKDENHIVNPNDINKFINKNINQNKIKQCIHPNHDECKGKIIKAHSIQNNRILNRLSFNGEVKMIKPNVQKNIIVMDMKDKGRGAATTFTGFCGYHDNKVFEDIEEKDYSGELKQNFLFSYRAFAFEYHKKMEAFNAYRSMVKMKPSLLKDKQFLRLYRGYELSIKDFHFHKEMFDKSLIEESYTGIETLVLTLDKEVNIALCSGFAVEYDLKGNKLNDVTSLEEEPLKFFTFNLFPQGDKTIVLFSWLQKDRDFYKGYIDQLVSLTPKELERYLNNLIPSYVENLAVNPALWDQFSEEQKDEFLQIYLEDFSVMRFDAKKNLMEPRSYDLFGSIF